MVSQEVPACLSCAQCEIAFATLECIDEELLYCAHCSASLHSKRARLHHSVKPFQTCDECEAAVARVRCASCAGRHSEPLVFCADCSALLHSKKARHHHHVEFISSSGRQECKDAKAEESSHTKAEAATFSRTEEAVALTSRQSATQGVCIQAASVSGEQGFSLIREEQGPSSKRDTLLLSNAINGASKQANTQRETQVINSQNPHKEGNTQKPALNTREDGALLNSRDSPMQREVPLANAVGIVNTLDASKEVSKKAATLTGTEAIFTGTEAVLAGTEVDGVAFMKKAAPSNTHEGTKIEEVGLTSIKNAHDPTITQKASPRMTAEVASLWTEQAASANTEEVLGTWNVAPTIMQQVPLFSTPEASHNGPSQSTEEADKTTMLNVSKEAQLVGSRPIMPQSHPYIHFVQPPFQSDCIQPTLDNRHLHSPFQNHLPQSPCQSQYQGPHTPPPFQNHLFPHCTPLIPRHHLAESMWPLRTMEFSHNAFRGHQYNAAFMTPACQSNALISPPGYMPYSNQYYTGFIPQVDHSTLAYTPLRLNEHSQPIFPHENPYSIHSKSDDRQGPGSRKRVWSNLYEGNATPTGDKGGQAFVGNISKKMYASDEPTRANSPNQVNGEGTARTPPKNVHGDALPEQLSRKIEETCMQDTSFLEKGCSSAGEAISEKDSQINSFEKALSKDAPCNKSPKVPPSIASGVLPEVACEKAFMQEVLLEKVSATETCGKVSETAGCASGATSEERPNVLIPCMQLDDCLPSRTPIIDKSVPMASSPVGEVLNEKLTIDSMSSEAVPPPCMALDDRIPLKKPITGLLDKVIPIANGPLGEVRNEKLVSESLSNEVLSEMVPADTLPVRALPKVPSANVLPKEEPVDLMPGAEFSEFADTFLAGEDSPGIALRNRIPDRDLKEINPKEECALHESNIAHKYPTNRLKKVPMSSPLQVTQNPLPDQNKEEEETSRDSSEPSYTEEDTSADDETFNTKKYRRGTITLEATVMKGNLHDASSAITERILTMLRRGLRCSTSDDDARQALKNAQRRLTKYNLKQGCTSDGRLQNLQALKSGSCVVEFVPTGSSQRGRLDCWTYNLAQTVAKYFATDVCAQKLKVVFYGILQNARCAGHAYAATFNRVAAFSADYIPEKLLDEGDLVEMDRNWECPNKGVFSRKSRLAYKNDLVQALFKISKWQRQQRAVKAERVETADGVSHVPTHSVWMEGVPKNVSLVKKHGYETIEALTIYCRKAGKAYVEKKNWTIVSSKLKHPILG